MQAARCSSRSICLFDQRYVEQWLMFSLATFTTISFLPRCMECRRGIAIRILSVRPSVCPSVRLSVCHTRVLWQNGRKICPDFYTIGEIIYWEEWLVGATPSKWNFGSTNPHYSEIEDFQPIIARSASAVTPSEKSLIYANKKSNEPKMIATASVSELSLPLQIYWPCTVVIRVITTDSLDIQL